MLRKVSGSKLLASFMYLVYLTFFPYCFPCQCGWWDVFKNKKKVTSVGIENTKTDKQRLKDNFFKYL